MKTLYCKSAILLSVMLSVGITLGAQSLKKDFHKEYSASGSTELKIDNQFGNITIIDGDQNKIVIDVKVEVTGSDQSKAQKLFDKIDVSFKEEGNRIHASTEIESNNNNKSQVGKLTFRIDYTIKCAMDISLKLNNQFGDIILSSFNGPVNIDLQFGSLNAVSLTGPETKIDMQFGKADIGILKNASFDIQHCESVNIGECGDLSIDGQFTKIKAGIIKSLRADLNHSELSVGLLSEMLKLDTNFGSTTISKVAAGFSSIEIDQNYGSLSMEIDPDAGYKLSAEVNMGSIKVPAEMKLTKKDQGDLPGVSPEKVQGTYGNGSSSIRIDANMGSVKIK